jgi:hypothetical protein
MIYQIFRLDSVIVGFGLQEVSKPFRLFLFLSVVVLSWSTTAESYILEIAAADLPVYLRSNEKVVVLFTSPDRKCGFCAGADQGFLQAAQKLTSSKTGADWSYVTVQWQPWREVPRQVQSLGVSSIPSRGAFVQGKAVGWADGRETNIDHLTQGLLAAQAGQKWSPLPASVHSGPVVGEPVAPGPGKMSKEEFTRQITKPMREDWVDIQARREYLQALLKRCTVLHDQAESVLRPMHKEWGKKVFETAYDLTQASWLETTEGVRAIARQQARFEQSLREETGLAPQDNLSLAQCQKLSLAATERPVPPQPPRGSWFRGLNTSKEAKQ